MVLFLACLAGTLNLIMTVHRKAAVKPIDGAPAVPAIEPVSIAAPMKLTPAPQPRSASYPCCRRSPARPGDLGLPRPLRSRRRKTRPRRRSPRFGRRRPGNAPRRNGPRTGPMLSRRPGSKPYRSRSDGGGERCLSKSKWRHLMSRPRGSIARSILWLSNATSWCRSANGLKAAVAKVKQGEGSYAVLPYKGENGTWRRPIVLECANGTVTLLPKGPTFSLLDLSSMINPRSSPVILAIGELLRVQMSESPDGAPVVPYFVFLVRPDGIRPYYEIHRLERLGIAFGYELIDQNLKVEVPDFDNVATWDGTVPLEEPIIRPPVARGSGTTAERGDPGGAGNGLAWPSTGGGSDASREGTGGQLAGSPGAGKGDRGAGGSPEDFVWPAQPGGRRSRGPAGSGGLDSGASSGLAQGLAGGTGAGSNPVGSGGSGGKNGMGAGEPHGVVPGQTGSGGGLGWPGSDSTGNLASAGTAGGSGGKPGQSGTGTGLGGQPGKGGSRPGAAKDPAPALAFPLSASRNAGCG